MSDYNGLLPNFEKLGATRTAQFLHIPKRLKCMKCKGKREQDNGNAFWCTKCLKAKGMR